MEHVKSSTHRRKGCCMLLYLIAIALAGCDMQGVSNSRPEAVAELVSRRTTFDAGIVLSERLGYLCLPLELVGLTSTDQVISITSSCECIRPRVVRYATSANSEASGILLEYVAEHGTSALEPQPVNLGVILEFKLSGGGIHKFTVDLLHTHLVGETSQ